MSTPISHDGVAYIIAAVIAFLVAQGLKMIISSQGQKLRNKGWRRAFESGRMPSSHTTVVVAFASSILFTEGVSKLFAIAVVFAMVTIYDSLVVRRSSGEQGTALLKLLEASVYSKDPMPYIALGHKPLEVIAGFVLGVMIGGGVAIFIT